MIASQSLIKVIDSIRFLQAIQQSGKIMFYYNLNQLMRMKIKKNEFKVTKTSCLSP
jgi:hypothetical protein